MEVFRQKLKEHRGAYFVTYQPADSRLNFAVVNLVFLNREVDCAAVAIAMEQELEHWLQRFAVPAMVSSFDLEDELIDLSACRDTSHLMGFVGSSGEIAKSWRIVPDKELPQEQVREEHFSRVYAGVPLRLARDVRRNAQLTSERMARTAFLILFLMVVLPVIIQVIALGISWLAWLLSGISILAGIRKAAKTFGWIKSSKREKHEAEKRAKMEHYYYHCERNPEGFAQLKIENFRREIAAQTLAEAANIPQRSST